MLLFGELAVGKAQLIAQKAHLVSKRRVTSISYTSESLLNIDLYQMVSDQGFKSLSNKKYMQTNTLTGQTAGNGSFPLICCHEVELQEKRSFHSEMNRHGMFYATRT